MGTGSRTPLPAQLRALPSPAQIPCRRAARQFRLHVIIFFIILHSSSNFFLKTIFHQTFINHFSNWFISWFIFQGAEDSTTSTTRWSCSTISGDWTCPISSGRECGKRYAQLIISTVGKMPHGDFRVGPRSDRAPRDNTVYGDVFLSGSFSCPKRCIFTRQPRRRPVACTCLAEWPRIAAENGRIKCSKCGWLCRVCKNWCGIGSASGTQNCWPVSTLPTSERHCEPTKSHSRESFTPDWIEWSGSTVDRSLFVQHPVIFRGNKISTWNLGGGCGWEIWVENVGGNVSFFCQKLRTVKTLIEFPC